MALREPNLPPVVPAPAELSGFVPDDGPGSVSQGSSIGRFVRIAAGLLLVVAFVPQLPSVAAVCALIVGILMIGWELGPARVVRTIGIPDPVLWLSVAWLALVLLSATFASVLPLAEARSPARALTEPILASPDLFSRHPLGTDRQGLDVLGGIIYGARVSLIVGFGAAVIGVAAGGTLGVVAGYLRGRVDYVAGLLNDALLAFPPLILLLALAAVLDPNVRNTALALGVLSVPTFFRLARANAIAFSQRDFVLASHAVGATGARTLRREIVPNVLLSVMSYAFIMVAVLIVAEASLSYLGLGIQRPQPTWGNMISAGQTDFDEHAHLVFAPGLVLFLTVLSLNRLGDHLRRRLDTRSEKL